MANGIYKYQTEEAAQTQVSKLPDLLLLGEREHGLDVFAAGGDLAFEWHGSAVKDYQNWGFT